MMVGAAFGIAIEAILVNGISGLFDEVRDRIAGACEYCSKAYGVREGVESAGIELLGEYEQHPSLHRYASDGYPVIRFEGSPRTGRRQWRLRGWPLQPRRRGRGAFVYCYEDGYR